MCWFRFELRLWCDFIFFGLYNFLNWRSLFFYNLCLFFGFFFNNLFHCDFLRFGYCIQNAFYKQGSVGNHGVNNNHGCVNNRQESVNLCLGCCINRENIDFGLEIS